MSTKQCSKCRQHKPVERMEYATCRDCKSAYQREYRAKNRERVNEYQRAAYERNPDKIKQSVSQSRKNNPSAVNAMNAKYRAAKLQATASWADEQYIADLYDNAAEASKVFGIPFHVDHMIPLQGVSVCGLHVEHNLQVLPAAMNLRKSNKLEEQYSCL